MIFIKSFVTIFLALFYFYILNSGISPEKEADWTQKLTCRLLTWFIQAIIGANIVVLLYYVWS